MPVMGDRLGSDRSPEAFGILGGARLAELFPRLIESRGQAEALRGLVVVGTADEGFEVFHMPIPESLVAGGGGL